MPCGENSRSGNLVSLPVLLVVGALLSALLDILSEGEPPGSYVSYVMTPPRL